MSALAMILAKNGYSVSGSDQKQGGVLKELAANKINIFPAQHESNIKKIVESKNITNILVVISSAIKKENEELKKANEFNLPIKHRSEILKLLIDQKESIVVSGSHGKTTTSTYITTILSILKKDPTAVIGGIVPLYKKNYNVSNSKLLVAEADESDGSLVRFKPKIGVITNLELEHVDYYENLEDLIKTIKKFSKNCTCVIANYDCKNLKNNIQPSIWFSTKTIDNIDFSLIPEKSNAYEIIAKYYEKEKYIDTIKVPVPGIHNLSNTIAAIAACRTAGNTFENIKKGIEHLKLPSRRFEVKGAWENRLIIDDYAHHPTEVDAAISIASLIIKKKDKISNISPNRIVTVFQPHRFSRIKKFEKEFAKSLIKSDLIFITPIYSAGEERIQGVSHHSIANEITKLKPNQKIYTPNNNKDLIKLIKEKTIEKDLLLIMGAGDIHSLYANLFLDLVNNTSINFDLVA